MCCLFSQVTVEGFEPLLQFAYTSKLTFTKENIHAIRKSAEFLGFNNLESACFDFLIPKFSEGKGSSQEAGHRPCCRNQDPGANDDCGVQSSRPESSGSLNSVPSRDAGPTETDFPSQCPQGAPGQFKSREEHLSLETCGPQVATLSLEISGSGMCPMLPSANLDANKADHSTQFCERDLLEIGDVCNQSELSLADCDLSCDLSASGDINPSELIESESSDAKQTVETLGAETTYGSSACLVNASGAGGRGEPFEQKEDGLEQRMEGEPTRSTVGHKDRLVERSSVEREVAEHLAKGFWSDSHPSQPHAISLESTDQNNVDKASDFHWLKQLDLSSSVGDCPFLKDLETSDDPVSRDESLTHSEKSPCMSSLNSGDDSDLDTDGDAEANKKRAEEVAATQPRSV